MSKAGDSSVSTQNQKQPADQPERDLTLFGDENGHNHNINSEQGSLSQAILASINRLNNNFQHFTQQFETVEGDEYDEVNDNPNNVNILADIENIASSDSQEIAQNFANSNEHDDDVLQYASQLDLDDDVKGPKINEKIASIVNKLRLQRITQEQSKSIMKRHNKPENVEVRLPKCEQSIWNEIPGKARVTDVKFQTVQTVLLSSINCQLEVANTLLASNADKDVLTTCLDGITLAMTANYDLNLRRREAMRPQFKPEFAKGLCSSTSPADEFLFGGDTAKRVKEINELNKLKVCRNSSTYRGRFQRYNPYPSRGARGAFSFRGRGYRGRGFTYTSASQRQNFQNLPQSEKRANHKSTTNWYVELDTIKSLISNQPPFMAGNTKNCLKVWTQLTSDPEILDYAAHCHIEFTDDPAKYSCRGHRNFTADEHKIISKEVTKLLELGVIINSNHEHGECISPIFVVPKPDGSHRLIFNMKNCNQAVLYRHFKMDTLASILSLVTPGAYMATIDLRHAYYTIPIASEHQKFLKFLWNGNLYQFTALPMGLSSSPRIFTKLMKPVLAALRQKGHINSGYIDDFYLQGQLFGDCASNVCDTVRSFISLGLYPHPDKCCLIPKQEIVVLGFVVNSLLMIVTLTPDKKKQLLDLCAQVLKGGPFPIQFIASVIGKLIAAFPGVEFGRLHYRHLERDKIKALALNSGDFNASMSLSSSAIQDVEWWHVHVMDASRRIRPPPITYIFQTDASDSGWGITCVTDNALESQGVWSAEQQSLHINVRELYVAFICLTIFCPEMSEVHICFHLDNSTAVSYVNQMGGMKSLACDTVARKIWDWCIVRNIWVSAVHIAGSKNAIADKLSRKSSDHEWQLNKTVFQSLVSLFPNMTIDLFASYLNRQLPRYVAWHPDPQASFVDAFSISWSNEFFYAFPPFSLIRRCLEKITVDTAEGILVVPAWPTQTWYTQVLQMLFQQPKLILWTSERDLLIHPSAKKVHNMQGKLKLMVCPLSGDSMKAKAFLNTLPAFSLNHGALLRRSSTQCISKDGMYSVVHGKLLHIPLL
jgi:hypothetical protein